MKHLLTFFTCLFAMSLSAQIEFPYNPDSNSDDVIGTVDLLELLSLFGEEFSEEGLYINTDSTQALYYIANNKKYHQCFKSCADLPGNWRIPTVEEYYLFDIESWGGYNNYWAWASYRGTAVSHLDKEVIIRLGEWAGDLQEEYHNIERSCYCATHERPKVEYSVCFQPHGSTSMSGFLECCELKVQEGWYPLSSNPTNYGANSYVSSQAFWRWAE